MSTTQRALESDPGRFRAVLTFDTELPESFEGRKQAVIRSATLLKELESPELADKPLKVLVALAARVLESHEQWPRLALEYVQVGTFHDTAPAVLVQIAAETEDERTYALRLVKRVFKGALVLREEYYGGRHLMSREAFGYRDGFVEGNPSVPQSAAVPGVSWLLYQRCVQDIDGFYAAPSQDDIIGRGRDEPATETPRPGSHIHIARYNTTGQHGQALLLRRSFSYETYGEVGMIFLASAAESKHFAIALAGLEKDPLRKYMTLETGGIYVVPPSAEWLAPGEALEALGAQRPPAEEPFYPKHALLLYEVSPSTLKFFLRAFHDNKDNFDENGTLRDDLKLLAKGLAKLLYGARLRRDGQLYRLLERAFSWDVSAAYVNPESGLHIEDLRRAKANGLPEIEIARHRAKLREEVASDANARHAAREVAHVKVHELFAELIADDAEFLAGSSEERREDFESLIELCMAAADEAREINQAAGRYMTIMC